MSYIELINEEIESYALTPIRKTVIEIDLPIFDDHNVLTVFQNMLNSYECDTCFVEEFITTAYNESNLSDKQIKQLENMASELIEKEMDKVNLTALNSVVTAKVYVRPFRFFLVLETCEI